jgi:hypothetical protein
MTNPNELITVMYDNEGFKDSKEGLTKREYFAAKILGGICANREYGGDVKIELAAYDAVRQADALIDALNKKQ